MCYLGADRVAANGDVINKIGTYMLSLAAYDNGIPAYAAFPISTIDFTSPNGDTVPIEERDLAEVLDLTFRGKAVMPEGATARNYAFDVTPHRLLSGSYRKRRAISAAFSQLGGPQACREERVKNTLTGSIAFDYFNALPRLLQGSYPAGASG